MPPTCSGIILSKYNSYKQKISFSPPQFERDLFLIVYYLKLPYAKREIILKGVPYDNTSHSLRKRFIRD